SRRGGLRVKALYFFLRHRLTALFALAVLGVLFGLTQLPTLAKATRDDMASRFRFRRAPLPELKGYRAKSVRAVNPSLKRIDAWISSVGAGAALGDLDGDGLPNDLCQVDPRTDQVMVAPVPGTGSRYHPFALDPSPVHYEPATMAPMGCLIADLN